MQQNAILRCTHQHLFLASPLLTAFQALSIVLLSGCTPTSDLKILDQKVKIQTPDNQVTVNFCTDVAEPLATNNKLLVILDHSGSNQSNYEMSADGSGSPVVSNNKLNVSVNYATDPKGITRYGYIYDPPTSTSPLPNSFKANSLMDYIQSVANSGTTSGNEFALINFNGNITEQIPGNGTFNPSATSFLSSLLASANDFPPTDGGYTSYLNALTAAYRVLFNDVNTQISGGIEPTYSAYTIIFMSDGSPITKVNGVNAAYSLNGQPFSLESDSTSAIIDVITNSIMPLMSYSDYVAAINLYTIYYYQANACAAGASPPCGTSCGNIDCNSRSILQAMAQAGHGTFTDLVGGATLDYSQFKPPQKTVKYLLADVFVTNSSVTWWQDGLLYPDTDQDGLPDFMEAQFGTSPTNPSSHQNGVSDFVEYQLSKIGYTCQSAPGGICDYANHECSTIPHTTDKTSTLVSRCLNLAPSGIYFRCSVPDGLNDCEKTLLNDGAAYTSFDGNTDYIPDWLEFKNGVQFQIGTSPNVNVATVTGDYTIYDKIKLSLPTYVASQQVLGLKPAQYQMTQVSTSATQDCYSLKVNNIPTLGPNNTIRVDVILKSPLLSGKLRYRVGLKSFPTGAPSMTINDWNDPTETTLGTWKLFP